MRFALATKLVLPLALVVLFGSGASSCDPTTGGNEKGKGATDVEFIVTGTAPAGVDITYGNDSSNYQGPSQPPMDESLSVEDGALYYTVTAQLQGGGDVTCKLIIGDAVKIGHARGGYNICSAQLNSGFEGGWG